MLENLKNYGPFIPYVTQGSMTVNTDDITTYTWDDYYNGAMNIMKDGIELTFVHQTKIDVVFGATGEHCRLTIFDLFFNIIMWYLIVRTNQKITPAHLFFDKAITKGTIKRFIDYNFIIPSRETIDFKRMNNLIDDTLHSYMDVDAFSAYLASTVNLEDFVALMINNPRFNELMNIDLVAEKVPLEDIKSRGMEYTKEGMQIIEDSKKYIGYEHCLADSFRSREGTKDKQFKEFAFSVGTKPDGKGGAHSIPINASYLNGGLYAGGGLAHLYIESDSARYAQIITKNKVGDSGNFARIVGLNSIDSVLYNDPQFDCHTHNFLKLTISSADFLKLYRDRWYREYPDGPEKLCHGNERELIGRTLYFRSPETCASEARGHGICFKCYGKLAFTNRDIKPGKMAAELFTNKTTQERLSSKHLLETRIKKFKWNINFDNFIEMTTNALTLRQDNGIPDPENWSLLINKDDITLENELDYDNSFDEDSDNEDMDDTNYNEYVTRFYIMHNTDGAIYDIAGDGEEYKLYVSNTLNTLIRQNAVPKVVNDMNCAVLNFLDIEDAYLFFTHIENSELGKSLNDIQALMDKKQVTESHTYSSLTQAIIEAAIEGNLGVMAVHYEVLIMNQIRNAASDIQKPNWDIPDIPYRILTLKQALTNNPSIAVSLLYQYLKKALYHPLSFKKTKPSFMDLFFMKKPQSFLNDTSNIVVNEHKKPDKIVVVQRVHRKN